MVCCVLASLKLLIYMRLFKRFIVFNHSFSMVILLFKKVWFLCKKIDSQL
ncbi:MAG: hypothetical protein JWM14_1536 [Chitinophagaceae bacterium]|nr:hypothetical protein [Chitinophagaceae bacterium]